MGKNLQMVSNPARFDGRHYLSNKEDEQTPQPTLQSVYK